jgi:uncharacterized membrane protein YsdA (DUF1294 family)/cold shock CspA family protein
MRKRGKIVQWNNDKGFGFIAPRSGGKQLFFHIKHFKSSNIPSINQAITYAVTRDMQGRICAINVLKEGEILSESRNKISYSFSSIIVFIFAAFLVFATWSSKLPIGISGYYIIVSLITYIVYAVDKSAAQEERRRISENTLHVLSLIGGWPGALIAQEKLRHKSKKQSFRMIFWFMVCINITIFFWFFGEAIFLS